ncbi:MAG: hypothetical protein K2O15_00925 [Lachnospiraceae bacterium]|nr:hypothetical protein [Lachnospiraceae bacterium]
MNQCKMERIPQMKELIREKADSLMSVRLKYIENLLESHKDSVRKDFELALERLVSEKNKGSLVISFLRSSYILNSHEFYIAFYEEEPFVEEEPADICFSMEKVFDGIEEDWHEMDEMLQQNFIRVFAGEKAETHRWYMERLYVALGSIIMKMIEELG